MINHLHFNLPLCLVIDEDIFERGENVLERYLPGIKGQKTIIITESFLHNLYKNEVQKIRENFGNAEVWEMVKADFDEAVSMAKKICMENVNVIIGFGGGRVLDVAKYAAFVSKTTYICLPSNLSNDSLASPFSVLGTVGSNRKTFKCQIPAAIIVDTSLIGKAPSSQTIGGIGDTIAKYTAVYDWKLASHTEGTNIDDFAYAMSSMCFDSVVHCDEKNIQSKSFLAILARALIMGGLAMEIAGSSRPSSGSEHLFCHVLEEYYPEIKISHGYAVALGSVGAANFQGRDDRKIIEACKMFGLDLNPKTYGIDRDLFETIWKKAINVRPERITILNSTSLNREWLDQIYDRMTK